MRFSTKIPEFQLSFDNTSISIFKDCPRKYYYTIVQGYRTKIKASPLTFGSAYHAALEEYELHLSSGVEFALRKAIRVAFAHSKEPFGVENTRTRTTLIRSIIWYSEQFKSDPLKTVIFPNGRLGLEMSFSFELPFQSQNGELLEYCGHIDKLADYQGQLFAVERKHTVQTLSPQFFSRYQFSAQIAGYVFAGKVVFDRPVSGAIIEATQVGVNFSRFGRNVVYRVNDHLEEWMQDTHYWINQIESAHMQNYFPHNSESCSKYAGCQFREVCIKPKFARDAVLNSAFIKDKWDPTQIRGD